MTANSPSCPFCVGPGTGLFNRLAHTLEDKFPVTPGHTLIVPARHVADFFETTREEREAMLGLAAEVRNLLDRKYHPDGYNLGINVGLAAGQTIFHVHLHVIPRYRGDVENPRGGVRGVIPAKQNY